MPAGREAGVEARQVILGQPAADRGDRRLPLLHRRRQRSLEVVVLPPAQEAGDHRQRRSRILHPRRQRGVAHALGAPAVLGQELVQRAQPLRHRRLDRAPQGGNCGRTLGAVEDVRDRRSPRGDRQLPQRPVGLHDLRGGALEEAGDVAFVDADLDTRSSEREVVPDERIHQLEVDLPDPAMERPELGQVDPELVQSHCGKVGALEVGQGVLDPLQAQRPELGEPDDGRSDQLLYPAGPLHELPLARAPERAHVGVHSTHARRPAPWWAGAGTCWRRTGCPTARRSQPTRTSV